LIFGSYPQVRACFLLKVAYIYSVVVEKWVIVDKTVDNVDNPE